LFSQPTLLDRSLGLGRAKTAILVSIKEIIKRVQLETFFSNRSKEWDGEELLKHLIWRTRAERRECFYLVSFDPENSLKRIELLSKGSLQEVGVHFRDIAKILLDDCATSALIAHNHPEQTCKPSEQDWILFHELKNLLEPLEIELKDQWILGKDGVFSCHINNFINTKKKSLKFS
jgi:DNA repair protein RadC